MPHQPLDMNFTAPHPDDLLGKYTPATPSAELALQSRLRRHVDVLAGLIGPRHLGKRNLLEAAAAYIEREFIAIGDAPMPELYRVGAHEVANIVVERTGTTRPSEIVVVGAHYDTVPETPGADDNASAVAMLIESARLLKTMETSRTLRFIAFPCEEPPHFCTDTMGSQQYARACRVRGDDVVGMMCLEMVGYYSTKPGSQSIPESIPGLMRWAFPKQGDFLAAVANLRSISLLYSFRRGFKRSSRFPLYCAALPERVHEIRLSDNGSFWDQGFQALMITDTSFLRNPHYHLASDTTDTLDYGRLTLATIGVAGGVARVAKGRRSAVLIN